MIYTIKLIKMQTDSLNKVVSPYHYYAYIIAIQCYKV